MINLNELSWWINKVHDYQYLDDLNDIEAKRFIFCCLEFILKSLAHDRINN